MRQDPKGTLIDEHHNALAIQTQDMICLFGQTPAPTGELSYGLVGGHRLCICSADETLHPMKRLTQVRAMLSAQSDKCRYWSCTWLQEHTQELAWQLGEAQRHFSEAQRERDQVKNESAQHLQTVSDAEVRSCQPMNALVFDWIHEFMSGLPWI